jgi:hypothetical protein
MSLLVYSAQCYIVLLVSHIKLVCLLVAVASCGQHAALQWHGALHVSHTPPDDIFSDS